MAAGSCAGEGGCIRVRIERRSCAELGKHHAQMTDHDDRSAAAGDDRADRTDERRRGTRSASPSSFEAEMNKDDTAPTRPRIVVGRVELDQRLADVDREHVGRAEHREAEERQRHRPRQAEDDRRQPEQRDRAEHLGADAVFERPDREKRRGQRRADRRRGAQHAEPLGPDMEHVAREHRQHRGRPAEQHREQIELIAPSTSRLRRT